MKKLLLLFGVASVLLLSNFSSAMAAGWEVSPSSVTLSNNGPWVIFTSTQFLVNGGGMSGGYGTMQLSVTGGIKYRATLVLISTYNAGVSVSNYNMPGSTISYPAINTTVVNWVSGPLILNASGCAIPGKGICNYSLVIERYVN